MCAVMGLAANKCELHGCLPCASRGCALIPCEVLLPACGHAACVSRAQCSGGGHAARNEWAFPLEATWRSCGQVHVLAVLVTVLCGCGQTLRMC